MPKTSYPKQQNGRYEKALLLLAYPENPQRNWSQMVQPLGEEKSAASVAHSKKMK